MTASVSAGLEVIVELPVAKPLELIASNWLVGVVDPAAAAVPTVMSAAPLLETKPMFPPGLRVPVPTISPVALMA